MKSGRGDPVTLFLSRFHRPERVDLHRNSRACEGGDRWSVDLKTLPFEGRGADRRDFRLRELIGFMVNLPAMDPAAS